MFWSMVAACRWFDASRESDGSNSTAMIPLDIHHVQLAVDVSENVAEAVLTLEALDSKIQLSADNLEILSVEQNGEVVGFQHEDGVLIVDSEVVSVQELAIRYTFPNRSLYQFDGWMPEQGVSFIWPDACGNLYPCNPNTNDGLTFGMDVSGVPTGRTSIYASDSVAEGPPYMLAFAVGEYEKLEVGVSQSGIEVAAWYLDGSDGLLDAQYGTAHMVESLDWMESVYGPYPFGSQVGTVEVNWGADSYGGMEHHPFFHVGQYDFWNEETQIHELAHAWFGDSVRLECWEDFVLSEGTVTYMTAKTLQEVAEYDVWEYYVTEFLIPICEGEDVNTIVMPEGCNEIDFENDNLWSLATYMKGACFYEEVADVLGAETLDRVIGEFYTANTGQAATMEEMLSMIESHALSDQRPLIQQAVQDWLSSEACPVDYANRCRYRDGYE